MMKAIRAHNSLLKQLKRERKQATALKQQKDFLANPHAFTKKLLTPMKSALPQFGKAVADDFFPKTYGTNNRGKTYTPPPFLPRPGKARHPFNLSFPDFDYFTKLGAEQTLVFRSSSGVLPEFLPGMWC